MLLLPDQRQINATEQTEALGQVFCVWNYLLSAASQYDSLRDLWTQLASTFKGNNRATHGLLRQTLLSLSKESGEPVFLDRLSSVCLNSPRVALFLPLKVLTRLFHRSPAESHSLAANRN